MEILGMACNGIREPLGYQAQPLCFSWQVAAFGAAAFARTGRLQILAGDTPVWDSSAVPAPDCRGWEADFVPAPRTRYRWRLELTADDGQTAAGESWFETGKGAEPWQGRWIAATLPADRPAVLQRRFTLAEKPRCARIYLCGLGVYELYVNGVKAGEEFLAPGYHSYNFHLQAQTCDLTDLLAAGENTLEVYLGDGWFRGRFGFDGGYENLYGDHCCLIAELYADGRQVLVTDENWQCRPSPVLFSNIYDGEVYDARISPDAAPLPVRQAPPAGTGPLCDRRSLPVKKIASFAPAALLHSPKGETILDFGQNLTGWVEFVCRLPAGEKITLTAGEILQNGCFYHENLRQAKTEFTYISDGRPAPARPHFTFFGFRYMKVDCAVPVDPADFTAWHLRSDTPPIGTLTTGDPLVNRLIQNAVWSQADNSLDVPTDCPQRDERLGWTGDAQVFSDTACYQMAMAPFYRKYLWDMRAEQSALDGAVPNVVPRIAKPMIGEAGICPWADAAVILPWNLYRHYGDASLLAETYPGMRDWVAYQFRRETALPGPHLVKDGFHFADWLALDNPAPGPLGATDPLFIASVYYREDCRILAQAAAALAERAAEPQAAGYRADAERYAALAEEILMAIRQKWFDEAGLCTIPTQTASAVTIAFGLMPEKQRLEGDALAARVAQNGGHLNTGFVGTPVLCRALTMTGHNDLAVDLLLNPAYPGWLYEVNLGATTIWERWNSVLPDGSMNPEGMNSLNHYAYGSIVGWMYRDLCGLEPAAPGFARLRIAPHPDARLKTACASLRTPYGPAESGWRCADDGTIEFTCMIPFGATAEIRLPEGQYLAQGQPAAGSTFVRAAGTWRFTRQA